MKTYPRVLIIAGSDSGGGAGIQADIKTVTCLGGYAATAITCLTAQNTLGVQKIFEVSPQFVKEQIQSVIQDIGADAVKIGMMYSEAIVKEVAGVLSDHPNLPIILDPVMVATSGDPLLREDAVSAIVNLLFPLSNIITPNVHEAALLWGKPISNDSDIRRACETLVEMGANRVLLKGGDRASQESKDLFFSKKTNETHWLTSDRIKTQNTHGTGCTLSSAIATKIAQGEDSYAACCSAKQYISGAIKSGADFLLGGGHGPVHHSWKFNQEREQ